MKLTASDMAGLPCYMAMLAMNATSDMALMKHYINLEERAGLNGGITDFVEGTIHM